jgi:hypothetical protein
MTCGVNGIYLNFGSFNGMHPIIPKEREIWIVLSAFYHASRTRGSPDKKIAKALFPASDDADDLGSGANDARQLGSIVDPTDCFQFVCRTCCLRCSNMFLLCFHAFKNK